MEIILMGAGLVAFMASSFFWYWKYNNLMKWVREELPRYKRPAEEIFADGFNSGRNYQKSVQERSAR